MNDVSKTYPFKNAPVIYAETISNIGYVGETARLYLTRGDIPLEGGGPWETVAVAQIAMPIRALLNTAVFMEAVLEDAIKSGRITKEQIEEQRALHRRAESDGA